MLLKYIGGCTFNIRLDGIVCYGKLLLKIDIFLHIFHSLNFSTVPMICLVYNTSIPTYLIYCRYHLVYSGTAFLGMMELALNELNVVINVSYLHCIRTL